MSKQLQITNFYGPKGKKKETKHQKKEKHNSSREGSDVTEKLGDSDEDVQIEIVSDNRLVCSNFVLLTPGMMNYNRNLPRKLKLLTESYSKQKVMDFILGNLRYCRINNLHNLGLIKDDDFWGITMIATLEYLTHHIKQIDTCVRILTNGYPQVLEITRKQCFIIMTCMFLGILPRQMHEELVHFGELMTVRETQLNPVKQKVRLEKLKCILAYFKGMMGHENWFKGNIRLQRNKNTNIDFLDINKMEIQVPLCSVTISSLEKESIEDYCGKGIMIDFANKRLGGGVLRNGCVQEEVLFCIFPEAIISKILCEELDEQESLIIYGARRFSDYRGYSDTFEHVPLKKFPTQSVVNKSVLVAIDAIDFSKYPTAPNFQFSKKGVRRQISKAVSGFSGAGMDADDGMPIVTGRWGCGAFGGDQILKLLIQWIAASEANRDMIFITDDEKKVKELQIMVRQLRTLCILDIMGILDEYYRARTSLKNPLLLLDFLKDYVR